MRVLPVAIVLALLAAAPAGAHSGHAGPVPIELRGNALAGGYGFFPNGVPGMAVGEFASFKNADSFERHSVADATGAWSVGELAPGASALREFEAGTHRFLCTFHPSTMRGELAIAPYVYVDRVRVPRRKGRRKPKRRFTYEVVAVWAFSEPAAGTAYDVERRQGGGAWRRWRTGTRTTGGDFRFGSRRTPWEVRDRVRRADDAAKATEWSPAAIGKILP